MKIEIKYDKKADSVYLHFSDHRVTHSKCLDEKRTVDFSEEGEIRGIRFLSAGTGLKTDDLPYRPAIERALYEKGIAGIMYEAGLNSHQNADDPGKVAMKSKTKAGIRTVTLITEVIIFFTGIIAVDVMLMRNLFVVHSVPVILASILGLVVTLLPTVFGLLLLFAWIILVTGLARRWDDPQELVNRIQ